MNVRARVCVCVAPDEFLLQEIGSQAPTVVGWQRCCGEGKLYVDKKERKIKLQRKETKKMC